MCVNSITQVTIVFCVYQQYSGDVNSLPLISTVFRRMSRVPRSILFCRCAQCSTVVNNVPQVWTAFYRWQHCSTGVEIFRGVNSVSQVSKVFHRQQCPCRCQQYLNSTVFYKCRQCSTCVNSVLQVSTVFQMCQNVPQMPAVFHRCQQCSTGVNSFSQASAVF